MMLINLMLEEVAQAVVHPAGFIQGRGLLTNVVELEVVVAGFFHDDEAKPAAVLFDIAVAFPSAEWAYIRWALEAQGAPDAIVDARFRALWADACRYLRQRTGSGRSLQVTRGVRQGCPASGIVWVHEHTNAEMSVCCLPPSTCFAHAP